jgi:DNA adenine methylase
MTLSPSRALLRYHGGKWRLAPWIISHFPEHATYVEPFGGGASVLLRKPRAYAEVYNDLDGEVVNLFRVLRDEQSAEALRVAVERTPFAREEFDASYEETGDAVERARRLLLRSHGGFGTAAMRTNASGRAQRTGFRANTTRARTTPAADWRGLPSAISAVAERMRGVVIEQRPAIQVMQSHDGPNTLHYVDPPYVHSTRGNSSRWNYRHEMTDDDHRALAAWLYSARGFVVLSGYASDLYDRELYSRWLRVERTATADGARQRTEVLWLNDRAAGALQSPLIGMGGAA